jgi:hypothetical protein|tara:strand:- start:1953 stop:2231 length:279 start_codon:yes stop_codon:yes gene_type:complete
MNDMEKHDIIKLTLEFLKEKGYKKLSLKNNGLFEFGDWVINKTSNETMLVTIKKDIYDKLNEVALKSGFKTPDEMVEYHGDVVFNELIKFHT